MNQRVRDFHPKGDSWEGRECSGERGRKGMERGGGCGSISSPMSKSRVRGNPKLLPQSPFSDVWIRTVSPESKADSDEGPQLSRKMFHTKVTEDLVDWQVDSSLRSVVGCPVDTW